MDLTAALAAVNKVASTATKADATGRTVTVVDGHLVFRSGYDAALVAALKFLPGRRYNAGDRTNRVSLASLTDAHAAFVAEWGFEADGEARAALAGSFSQDSAPANPRQAKVVDGVVHLIAPYDEALVAATRGLSGRRYLGGDVNSAPLNGTTRDFALRWGFDGVDAIEVALANRSDAEKAAEAKADALRVAASAVKGEEIPSIAQRLRRKLFGYQWAGVRYILSQRRVLVGDEMGTGKTTIALASIEAAEAYPAVVVVPEITRSAWEREAQKVLPAHRTVEVVTGTTPVETTADVVIVGYTVLQHHVPGLIARKPMALVADEAHFVKNPKAARTQAVAALAEVVPA